MLAHAFMRHAFLAGTFVALASGVVGYFVVLRAQVFAGDALSHVAFTGALAAAAAGIDVRVGLFVATVGAAAALGLLGERARADDVVIGSAFAWILGLGALFLSIFTTQAGDGNGTQGARVLFGSIFGLSAGDAVIAAAIGAAAVVATLVLARPLLFASLDPLVAEAQGVPVRAIGIAFLIVVGVVAAEATQAVGALLLLGLLAAPAGAARLLVADPWRGVGVAAAIAVGSMWAGLALSYRIPHLPPSTAVILVAAAVYLGVALRTRLRPIAVGAAAASLVAIALAGCGSSGSQDRGGVDRFDADRAWSLVERQLSYGQRPAGSRALRRLADRLRPLLPNGHFEPLPHEHGLRNVVGTLPGRRPGIVVGAHYDTLVKPKGFVGANNGAAGTAIVIEAARALAARRPTPGAREVRFVLFDGEEPARGLPEDSPDFEHQGLRGSRAYVAAHPGRTKAMLLLDYVGNRGLRLPRESSSNIALWSTVRAAARTVGAGRYFPPDIGPDIVDDHSPFLSAGVPAVDFIDWNYPGHELGDRLDKLSRASIDAVGETVVETALRLR